MTSGARLVSGLALLLAASGCTSEPSDEDYEAAYEQAEDELSSASFEDVGDASDCTIDCSGHEAGFAWARDEGVTDASECSGNSDSFVEGCETYAYAVEEMATESVEAGE